MGVYAYVPPRLPPWGCRRKAELWDFYDIIREKNWAAVGRDQFQDFYDFSLFHADTTVFRLRLQIRYSFG